MPPKSPFTVGRAEQFGEQAATKAITRLGDEASAAIQQLTCSYRGVATAEGGVNVATRIVGRSILVYEWRAIGDLVYKRCEARVRADNASTQGVPFPIVLARALRSPPARGKLRQIAQRIAPGRTRQVQPFGPARIVTSELIFEASRPFFHALMITLSPR